MHRVHGCLYRRYETYHVQPDCHVWEPLTDVCRAFFAIVTIDDAKLPRGLAGLPYFFYRCEVDGVVKLPRDP